MILTRDNLQEWKKELDKYMEEQTGICDLSTSCNDDEWLRDYLEEDHEDVVYDQISLLPSDG
ncbi:MAG: hypothetical protein PHG66_06755 [Candidatus Colwellbacteria bacterium]|nr:hypothetical protein [Candidatus Colwellbacteria bacterium]